MTATDEELDARLDEYYSMNSDYEALSLPMLLLARDNLRKDKLDAAKRLDIIASILRDGGANG